MGIICACNYRSKIWLQALHFAFSSPTCPMMKILPIVLHSGHKPVVTFFGPVLIIFCVFLRANIEMYMNVLLNLIEKARGEGFEPSCSCEHGISNPTPYQARRPPHVCC